MRSSTVVETVVSKRKPSLLEAEPNVDLRLISTIEREQEVGFGGRKGKAVVAGVELGRGGDARGGRSVEGGG